MVTEKIHHQDSSLPWQPKTVRSSYLARKSWFKGHALIIGRPYHTGFKGHVLLLPWLFDRAWTDTGTYLA